MVYTQEQIDAIKDADEKDKLSRKLSRENELKKQKYGEC